MPPPSSSAPGPLRTLSRRRFLGGSAAAAATAAAAPLTGCGDIVGTSERDTLQFWNFYAPAPSEDPSVVARAEWMQATVDQWNAENPEQIELVFAPMLGSEKLATAFAAGTGPDIFLISPGDIIRYINGDVLVDLAPYLEQQAIDDFFPDNMASRVVGDQIFALPMEIEPLALYYSRPAFEQAGLAEGDLPTTWDDMLGIADRLIASGQGGLVVPSTQGYYQNFVWYPWMWQGGGSVLSDDGTSSAFDNDAAIEALRLWQTAVERGLTPRVEPAGDDIVTSFVEGYASIWQSGIWSISDFRRRAPEFDYGAFPLPTPPGGEQATALGGWAFAANADGANPDAAARFCAWALGSTDTAGVARVAEWCVETKTDIPPRVSSLEHAEQIGGFDTEIMSTFRDDIFPTGIGEPRFPPVIYKAVSDAIQSCQLAGGQPEEQAATAAQGIDAYLKTYEGAPL
ncbi:carbohydrate ABC transporter substrate-binding protein (CUT1 family) [Haloactinopolyspora alba]|uniref:Carbohydrate ABC transporter substrate-binding protein (CUT1 family) n=1 Tax=Haloactinopolyspora alba TaxID=648780 RepID=A0A2P8D241_9ACTN|nr:sugar ABC transporter substrate-binding protein [Haloactinopolyspora alba]PSK91267.1 carbohydrate ABC transporter substrate-binding protein (CUT1 family) [Haloactinopolyspora alba]